MQQVVGDEPRADRAEGAGGDLGAERCGGAGIEIPFDDGAGDVPGEVLGADEVVGLVVVQRVGLEDGVRQDEPFPVVEAPIRGGGLAGGVVEAQAGAELRAGVVAGHGGECRGGGAGGGVRKAGAGGEVAREMGWRRGAGRQRLGVLVPGFEQEAVAPGERLGDEAGAGEAPGTGVFGDADGAEAGEFEQVGAVAGVEQELAAFELGKCWRGDAAGGAPAAG